MRKSFWSNQCWQLPKSKSCDVHGTNSLRFFLAKANLTSLFLSLTSGVRLVENPPYLHSWCCGFIIDFDNDMTSSLRVFSVCLDLVVKMLLFLTMEIILWASTLVVFCDLLCILVMLSWPVLSFCTRRCFVSHRFIRDVQSNVLYWQCQWKGPLVQRHFVLNTCIQLPLFYKDNLSWNYDGKDFTWSWHCL